MICSCRMKAFITVIVFVTAIILIQPVVAQKFVPDRNGYGSNPAFLKLIKQRGYQLVGAFDTADSRPGGPLAAVQKNGGWGSINLRSVEVTKPGPPGKGSPNTYEDRNVNPTLVPDMAVEDVAGIPFADHPGPPDEEFYTDNLLYQKFYADKTDTYGLRLKKDSTIILPSVYENIQFFTNDFALARQNKQYGIVSPQGKLLAPFQYEFLSPVYDNSSYLPGIFIYMRGGHKGLVDIHGHEITLSLYDQISGSGRKNILETRCNGKQGLILHNGTELVPCTFTYIGHFSKSGFAICKSGSAHGMIDTVGHVVMLPAYDRIWEQAAAPGVFLVLKNNKTGLVSRYGKELLAPVYESVLLDSTGIAIIGMGTGPNQAFGIADTSGHIIVEPRLSRLRGFSGRLLVFGTPGFGKPGKIVLGLMEKHTGKMAVAEKYSYIEDLRNNMSRVTLADGGLQGFIDSTGAELIPAIYDELEYFHSRSGLAGCTYKGKKGIINSKGQFVLQPEYDWMETMGGLIHAIKNGQHGIIDSAERIIIPFEYSHLQPLGGYRRYEKPEYLLAARDKKWGTLNINGSTAIPFGYDLLKPSRQKGHLIYSLKGKYGIMAESGVKITDTLYNNIEFMENAYVVSKGRKKGIISTKGKQLIPARYDDIGDEWFENGVAEAVQNGHRCRVDFYGNEYFY